MEEHNSGKSGASLEGPLSRVARGVEESLECGVLFEEELLREAAHRHAQRHSIEPHVALAAVVNFAEALGCALFRTHVADPLSMGGTNCTAGGQVFGPASLRINTLIVAMRNAYISDPAKFERLLDEPAHKHVSTDHGLLVSHVVVRGMS
jgi:hypothetical protein